MTIRLSKLFGMDIYTTEAQYKGKVFDIVINLEKGKLETITTEPLKARSKQEAKKIISEKSIPYRNVRAAQDIVLVSGRGGPVVDERRVEPASRRSTSISAYRHHRRR